MPIQKIVSSEKNNITLSDFIGEKDRLFFDVTTRTFRLSDGVTPGGIVVNTGGGGGGSYTDFSVDLHLNRATANSGEVLSWSGTDYAWIAQPDISTKIALTDLSVGNEGTASGDGAIAYNNITGVFTYTPPDLSNKISLTDLSIGTGAPPNGNGAIGYDNTTGVFSYTPPVIPDVTDKITLTDLSIGAEAPASGDGAISYDNTTGVFKYTPPVIPATLLNLGISDGTAGQLLQTDGAGNFSFTSISTGGLGNIVEDATPQLGGTLDANGNTIDMGTNVLTDTNLGQFITAYGWGDHGAAGYQTSAGLNAAIDSHLNQSNPTSGYVLSWNGSDYAWVAQSGGGGGTTVNPEFTESITLDSDETTDAVSTEFVIFYGSTTNATTTKLYRNSSNASISIAQQTTVFFEADVIGRDDGTPDYGAFKVKGIIDNDSNGNTQLISSQKEIIHAGANNLFDANIVADNTNDVLSVEVNGENSKNIRWSALVKVIIVKQT